MNHDILKRLGLDHLDVASTDFLDALNRKQRRERESLRKSEPLNDPEDIRARLEKQVDLVIDGGACPREPSTVIDLTGDEPELVRAGRGALEPFGLSAP